MRPYLGFANAVTSAGLVAGFVALLFVRTKPALAAGLVLLAAILDVVDGVVARRRGGGGAFGARLDSLSDVLCFCAVPAFAVCQRVPSELSVPAAAVGAIVVLSGAWRLARFPLLNEEAYFVGVPTPTSGVLIMVLAWLAPGPVVLAGALVLGGLGLTTIRVPTVFTVGARARQCVRSRVGRSAV
ncbi:MAG TPA: CDP-alcohol phosphatidyltransferase family protein [Thermoleophilaceae bacterium]|nr:CDP-alcohol phosphatidyltransferase family protein [Thermoleophilaceae bacterium]